MTAPQLYRSRLQARGLVGLQVTVSAQNRSSIRALAKRLAEAVVRSWPGGTERRGEQRS